MSTVEYNEDGVMLSLNAQAKRKEQALMRLGSLTPADEMKKLATERKKLGEKIGRKVKSEIKRVEIQRDDFVYAFAELENALKKNNDTKKTESELRRALRNSLPDEEKETFIAKVRENLAKSSLLIAEAQKKGLKGYKKKGFTPVELAHLQKMSHQEFLTMVKSITGGNLKRLEQAIDSRNAEVVMQLDENNEEVESPSALRNWIQVQASNKFALRCKYADPIISSSKKDYKIRLYPPRKDMGQGNTFYDWSNEMKIFGDDRYLQPVKRLRIAGQGWIDAYGWYGKGAYSLMPYTVKLADNQKDNYLTHEGGIIISETWAREQHLGIGDKILGINGLKGIVCEVRQQKPCMIISRNQLWSQKKLSRMCGGAVLEFQQTGKLKVFTRAQLNTSQLPFRNKSAKYGLEMVPFLANYLPKDELEAIIGDNRQQAKDFMHMINFEWLEENGKLQLKPLLTQPDLTRDGGRAHVWGHHLWSSTTEKPYLGPGLAWEKHDTLYPFIMNKIWIPDWLIPLWSDDNETGPNEEIKGLLAGPDEKEHQFKIQTHIVSLMHKLFFGKIPNSLSGLIATQKDGDPHTVLLSTEAGKAKGWIDGDTVLVFRNPVIAKRNIQQMTLKFDKRSSNTIGINIEALRKMSGDTDGDTLSVIRTDGGKAFYVPLDELEDERSVIEQEIKEQEEPLPTDVQEIQIAMREAFIDTVPCIKGKSNMPASSITQEKRLARFRKELPRLKKKAVYGIRTDEDLLIEAKFEHNKLNLDQTRTTKVGLKTKYAWLATEAEDMVTAIGAIEQMKDRPDKKSTDAFDKAIETFERYNNELKYQTKKGAMKFPEQITTFVNFVTRGTFKADSGKEISLGMLWHGKGCGRFDNPYAKYIMALCGGD